MNQNERPRFYEGQYLGADDLSAATDYERVQNARHALGAHTWGIAIGLDLVERPLSSGDVDVTIAPGVAWDGFGRPILVLAPAKLSADKFVNFQTDTPAEGALVKIWLRYDETELQRPASGFETCRVDDQHRRIVETFAIEVGDPSSAAHGDISVAARSIAAAQARSAFNPGAPDVYDESVPYQTFPDGKRPRWLIPIGYVRWLKQSGQIGRIVARNDKATHPDSDLIRAFRRYVGVVADTVNAADGVIRMRDRWNDPDPAKTFFHTPHATIDPKKPPINDLVWIEGHLRVLGDVRVAGGWLEFRDKKGSSEKVPLALRRVESNAQKGKDLQVVIGTESKPTGKHAFAVGPAPVDAKTGAPGDMIQSLRVQDDGRIGISTDAPTQLVTMAGDKKTRLEIGRVSDTFPWGSQTPSQNGDGSFAINQQSEGSDNPSADFALMRDQKLRVVLSDGDTTISSQGGGSVCFYVKLGEPGATEVIRVTAAGNVGIGTQDPQASLDLKGDLALESIAKGGARQLPNGATLVWNDGTWLRLNENRDFGQPIFGVRPRGVLAPDSLNVGGAGDWGNPGPGNAWFKGNVGIGTTTPQHALDVKGRIVRNGQDFTTTGVVSHGSVVAVPWGSIDDWNIFVSPAQLGIPEIGFGITTLVQAIECNAQAQADNASWLITAQCLMSDSGFINDSQWVGGTANWMLVPK